MRAVLCGVSDTRSRRIIQQVNTLLNDLRKTALIAGTAMALSSLWSFFDKLLFAAVGPATSSVEMAITAVILLPLDLCLPVFLLVVYRSGISPVVSRNLRNLALGLALIRGARLAVFGWNAWSHGINPASGHINLAGDGFGGWFYQSLTRALISDALELASILAFIPFLVALSRQTGTPEPRPACESRLVRKTALIAASVRGLVIIGGIGGGIMMYSMQQRGVVHNIARVTSIARNALFALPGLIAPLIVYASIRNGEAASAYRPLTVSIPEG
jgi:hypothetical protein